MANTSQATPDSGLGFQVTVLETCKVGSLFARKRYILGWSAVQGAPALGSLATGWGGVVIRYI